MNSMKKPEESLNGLVCREGMKCVEDVSHVHEKTLHRRASYDM